MRDDLFLSFLVFALCINDSNLMGIFWIICGASMHLSRRICIIKYIFRMVHTNNFWSITVAMSEAWRKIACSKSFKTNEMFSYSFRPGHWEISATLSYSVVPGLTIPPLTSRQSWACCQKDSGFNSTMLSTVRLSAWLCLHLTRVQSVSEFVSPATGRRLVSLYSGAWPYLCPQHCIDGEGWQKHPMSLLF